MLVSTVSELPPRPDRRGSLPKDDSFTPSLDRTSGRVVTRQQATETKPGRGSRFPKPGQMEWREERSALLRYSPRLAFLVIVSHPICRTPASRIFGFPTAPLGIAKVSRLGVRGDCRGRPREDPGTGRNAPDPEEACALVLLLWGCVMRDGRSRAARRGLRAGYQRQNSQIRETGIRGGLAKCQGGIISSISSSS